MCLQCCFVISVANNYDEVITTTAWYTNFTLSNPRVSYLKMLTQNLLESLVENPDLGFHSSRTEVNITIFFEVSCLFYRMQTSHLNWRVPFYKDSLTYKYKVSQNAPRNWDLSCLHKSCLHKFVPPYFSYSYDLNLHWPTHKLPIHQIEAPQPIALKKLMTQQF